MTNLPRDENGKLLSFAWPGGYPFLYLDGHNCVLCPDCANKYENDEDDNFRPQTAFIHYEGESVTCEQCNKETESAYGDPNQEEGIE